MVTMAQGAANRRNTHTHVDKVSTRNSGLDSKNRGLNNLIGNNIFVLFIYLFIEGLYPRQPHMATSGLFNCKEVRYEDNKVSTRSVKECYCTQRQYRKYNV